MSNNIILFLQKQLKDKITNSTNFIVTKRVFYTNILINNICILYCKYKITILIIIIQLNGFIYFQIYKH